MRGWRALQPLGALLATVAGVLLVAPKVYTLEKWNAGPGPMLVSAWGWFAVFVAASLSIGVAITRAAFPRARPDGFWALAFATGVTVFAVGNGVLAWLGLVGPRSFVLLPLVLLAVGLRSFVMELVAARVWRRQQGEGVRLSALELVVLAFGVVCVALISLQTIAAENANYDAFWYHLRAAERYALAGGQVRTPEGDLLLTLPQTASWLYTWAFLWPKVLVDDRVRLSLLLELGAVLGTLAAIPALVRAVCPTLPREATRMSWVVFFFFPSIFVYDTGLMGGSDHVVALWSVTALLTWLLARRSTSLGPWALLGIHVTGLLAKYSSIYVLVPLVPLVGCDWLVRWFRQAPRFSRAQVWGPIVTAAVALALTSPYWLRNAIWYHNPIYPMASGLFHNQPWNPDAEAWLLDNRESSEFTENGTTGHKLEVSIKALFSYQTELNTWNDMTEGQPVVGSMYFFSLLALPFIRDRKRLLVLLAFIMNAGILVWFNTHQHQMRYLTVLMAPMAAGAAAVGISLWKGHTVPGRLAVVAAVAYHLAAFGDMPFRKTHRMAGRESTVGVATSYLALHGGRGNNLFFWETVGNALPPSAVPLIHGLAPHLGLGRQSVTDAIGLQFGINYGRWGSQAEILRQLRHMGVTHLVFKSPVARRDSIAGEALFLGLATQTVDRKLVNGYFIGELPETAHELGGRVLYLGCGGWLASGLYTLQALAIPTPPFYHPPVQPPPLERVEGDWHPLLAGVSYVVEERDCSFEPPPATDFTLWSVQVGSPRALLHYVRTSPSPDY